MFIKLPLCVLSFTMLGVTLVFATERIKYNITYHHQCLDSVSLINFLLKLSLQQCVQECSLRPICLSINYRRRKLLCELYSEDYGSFIENSLVTGPCVFVKKVNFDPQVPVLCPMCDVGEMCEIESLSCVRKECPKLSLGNGSLIGKLRTVGSKMKISCNEYYTEVENRTSINCEENAAWSYEPRCIATICITLQEEYSVLYSNVALNKPVELSSIFSSIAVFYGHLMVDGNTNQYLFDGFSCAHTNDSSNSYAIIDFELTFTIYALRIFSRQDCCAERLRNVSVSIGESMDDLQLYVYHKEVLPPICSFLPPQPCRGRFLKIQNTDESALTICELQVYGELYEQ